MKEYLFQNSRVVVMPKPEITAFEKSLSWANVIIDVSDLGSLYLQMEFSKLGKSYFWFPMNERHGDMGLNSIYGAILVLDEAIKRSLHVVVHCIHGRNRSQIIVDCIQRLMHNDVPVSKVISDNYRNRTLPSPDSFSEYVSRISEVINRSAGGTSPLDYCKSHL